MSDLPPISPTLLEWAEYWYPKSWTGLLVAGFVTAIAAAASIAFLLLQWRTTTIREQQSEWRTSVLELQTAKANEAAGKAHERAAALERDAEASRAAIAEANARAAEAGQKAEEEKSARLKLEQALQPRHLTKAQAKAIGEHVRDHLPNLMLAYVDSDMESSNFAREIDFAIQEARMPDKGGLSQIVLAVC
jgi:hypothetical protein